MVSRKIYHNFKAATLLSFIAGLANIGTVAFARRTAQISAEFEPLTYTSVAGATVIAGYTAYTLFELLKKYTERPYEFFSYISSFILILSFMPIGHVAASMPEAGIAEINVLGLTHIVAAVFIIVGLVKIELYRKKKNM